MPNGWEKCPTVLTDLRVRTSFQRDSSFARLTCVYVLCASVYRYLGWVPKNALLKKQHSFIEAIVKNPA